MFKIGVVVEKDLRGGVVEGEVENVGRCRG